MNVNKEMYTTLFNVVTAAQKKLDEIKEMLKEAQSKTEDLYIDAK